MIRLPNRKMPKKKNLTSFQPKPGSTIDKIKQLGPDLMARVDSRLLAGEGGKTVAHWLQEELGHLKDVGLDTLKKTLERYRNQELKPKTLMRIAEASKGVSVGDVVKRLNALDELEQMVRYQAARVEKLLVKEKDMPGGMILNAASSELRLLKDMVVSLGSMQMETGLLPRAAKNFKGVITDETGMMKTFAWSEEQEELVKVLETVDGFAAEDA